MAPCNEPNGYTLFTLTPPSTVETDLQFRLNSASTGGGLDYSVLIITQKVAGGTVSETCSISIGSGICLKTENERLKFVTLRDSSATSIKIEIDILASEKSKPKFMIKIVSGKYYFIGIDDVRGFNYNFENPLYRLPLSEGVNLKFANNKLMIEGGLPI